MKLLTLSNILVVLILTFESCNKVSRNQFHPMDQARGSIVEIVRGNGLALEYVPEA
jgi:hypothetical protein